MNIAIFINTPAQVHFYKNISYLLKEKGHSTYLLARDYGETIPLLEELRLSHFRYSKPPISKVGKILSLPKDVFRSFGYLRKKNIDIITGFGTYDVLTSILLRRPVAVFCDSEPRINKWTFSVQFDILKLFTDMFITPRSFNQSMGKKHEKIRSFKEFSYLHPNYYTPNDDILDLLGIDEREKYCVMRFNAFDALHDAGRSGFSQEMKAELVDEMERHCRVFISSEGEASEKLKRNQLTVPKSRIHDVLSFSHLLITDTQTMTTEAAILGTPVVRCNSWVGDNDMSNFRILEDKYEMIFNFRDEKKAKKKAIELIKDDSVRNQWKTKRNILIGDNEDIVSEYCDILLNHRRV